MTTSRLPREAWILTAVGFLTSLGFGLIGPALPALADMFSIPAAIASLAISGFAAFRFVTSLTLGGFLARFRLRSVLIAGLAFQSVCSIIAGLVPDGTLFLLFRAISGLGSAALSISATALMLALVNDRNRGRAMGLYFGAGSLGVIIGPAIGGLLAIAEPRLPLILYGVCLGIGSFIALVALASAKNVRSAEAPQDDAGASIRTAAILRSLFSNPRFLLALSCQIVIGWVLYGMYVTTIPLHLGALGVTTAIIGLLMTGAAGAEMAGAGIAGTLSDRIGRMTPLFVGLLLGMAGIALVMFVGIVMSPGEAIPFTLLIPAFVCIGLAAGTLGTVPAAIIGDVPLGSSGPGVAAYTIAFDLAAIVGPLVAGAIADTAGFTPALLVAQLPFLLAAVLGVVAALYGRRRRAGA